jgi:hypothetical protein
MSAGGKGCSWLPVVIAAILLLANGAIVASGRIERIWSSTLRPGPGSEDPFPLPFEKPSINPFAIYGSPLGQFLGGLYVQAGDSAEHLGLPAKDTVPFQTRMGQRLGGMYLSMLPTKHEHVGDMQASSGERLQAVMARTMVAERLRKAYMLDPTNLQAIITAQGTIASPGTPEAQEKAISLFRHSLSKLRVNSGYWPEHCLIACQVLVQLWNVIGQPMGDDLVQLNRDVHALLEKAREQKQRLIEKGLWETRRTYQRNRYDTEEIYTGNLAKLLDQAVKESEESKKDTQKGDYELSGMPK